MATDAASTPKLLLPAPEAAHVLSISERSLWALTEPRGPIPCVRIGSRGIRYSVRALEDFANGRQDSGKEAAR